MSRIDDLKLRQKHLAAGLETLSKSIGCQKDELDRVEKELADLEKKASQPREVTIFVCDDRYSFMSADGWRKATFREVKPIVVTMEMARKMSRETPNGRVDIPEFWVRAFKVIGIDAEPSHD